MLIYEYIKMTNQLYGKNWENWEKQFIQKVNDGGVEKVLL